MTEPLAIIQAAVEDSKTDHQRLTGLEQRALFLGTEAGEVQKEVLKLLGNYGPEQAATAKERLAKEICDVIWNVCDLANMTGIELAEPLRAMLAVNKTRVWLKPADQEAGSESQSAST
jgi:NTP pyrophosphatase (non-canonical NTP hydrolase)